VYNFIGVPTPRDLMLVASRFQIANSNIIEGHTLPSVIVGGGGYVSVFAKNYSPTPFILTPPFMNLCFGFLSLENVSKKCLKTRF
jgi:hypothetical protein